MPLWLTLDVDRWKRGDFSSETKITGTIYTDRSRETAKNLTGFTLTFFIRKFGEQFQTKLSETATIVTAASGTWEYAVTSGKLDIDPGTYRAEIELTKSGVKESTYDELFYIEGSPT